MGAAKSWTCETECCADQIGKEIEVPPKEIQQGTVHPETLILEQKPAANVAFSDDDETTKASGSVEDVGAAVKPQTGSHTAELNAHKVQPLGRKLTLLFDISNCKRSIEFTKAPLGFEVKLQSCPPIVCRVLPHSHAEELGVEAGWRILEIDGQNVTRQLGEEAGRLIRTHSLERFDYIEESFSLGFEVDGKNKFAVFCKRPLGLEFKKDNPFKVSSVESGSSAASQGVQPEWRLAEVAGEDVRSMDWVRVMRMVGVYARRLPA